MPPKRKPEQPDKPVCNHDARDGILSTFLDEFRKGRIIICPGCQREIIAAPMGDWVKGISTADLNVWWHLEPQPAPTRCRDPVSTYYHGIWHNGHHTWGGYDSCRHQHHTCPPDSLPGGSSDSYTLF